MHLLKLMGQALIELLKQIWLLPHYLAQGIKRRQQQTALNELEVERLDRIRHPSKYLGK